MALFDWLLNKRSPTYWRKKARSRFEEGQHPKALKVYDRAIELAPNDVALWIGKATALAALKRTEEALAAYKRAIALDPGRVEFWDRAIELAPSDVVLWIGKATALAAL